MTPIVNGESLYFEASGLYDGLVLLGDTKTRSYWNHITGECLYGNYLGERLKVNNLFHYDYQTALSEFPDLKVAVSKPPFPFNMIIGKAAKMINRDKGFMPPFFRKTMNHADERLKESEIGLGVLIKGKSKFYKIEDIIKLGFIEDEFFGKKLLITYDEKSRVPRCVIKASKEYPLQLFTRWYGFSYTYKNCEIYEER